MIPVSYRWVHGTNIPNRWENVDSRSGGSHVDQACILTERHNPHPAYLVQKEPKVGGKGASHR